MKRTLPNTISGYIILLLLAVSNWANAQGYVSTYTFAPSIGTYTPLTTGTVLGTGNVDDVSYTNRDIGFTFVYDGVSYTKFSVTTNGFLVFGPTMSSAWWSGFTGSEKNMVAAMAADLQGSSLGELRFDTIGTAPFRKLVVQYANWSFYNSSTNTDSVNFQIILHETTNNIDIVYGSNVPTNGDNYVYVGLRGDASSDLHVRTTSTDWNATTLGNYWDQCLFSATGPIGPISGLTYRFGPPPKAYNTGSVTMPVATAVGPGATNEIIAKVKVNVTGIGSYLAATEFTVSTAGTTSLSDISNIKVYSTGASNTFSTATQVGTTVASPAASNLITDSINLSTGDNYFWVVYDIAAGATLGNVVDAEIPTIKIGGTNRIPTNSAPAGNRSIQAPMTFLSAAAFQSNLSKCEAGAANTEVLGVRVITSSAGSSINATQFDFSALGTTDTANISNVKLWYTGNSSAFATTEQVGATLANLPGTMAFSISGTKGLLNDTNYFWLTYDVASGATVGNVIDAECSMITVDATPQTPVVTAPTGTREIRAPYCIPIVSQTYACSWGSYITHVATTGATTNIVSNTGCSSSPNGYEKYLTTTLVTAQNQTVHIDMGDYSTYGTYTVWIDYNQDGVYDNITERVFYPTTTGTYGNMNGDFTVPCSALTGQTRMRVRLSYYWWFGTNANDPCSDVGVGETEEYNVIILPTPAVYAASVAVQTPGIVAPGTLNKSVLMIPVNVTGCGVPVTGDLHFSTAGTTSTGDITTATLYGTGTSATFNTSNPLGTVSAPNGSFVINANDTLVSNVTNYYWLSYDVSPSATIGNLLDAQLDSINVLGSDHIPLVTAPSGNVQVTAPMTYQSSDVLQVTRKVGFGTTTNEIIGIRVITSSTGAPVNITQFDLSADGTTDTAEISNFKLWYTGNSNQFAATNQFGATVSELPGTMNYTISGTQELMNDTNYFWLTYDIDGAAVIGNAIDATCTGVTVAAASQIPVNPAPAGARLVREEYCDPIVSSTWSCTYGYYISAVNTSGAVSNISNYTGCTNNTNYYNNYSNITMVASQTQTVNITLGNWSSYQTYTVWIDYNQDGVFDNTTERVFMPTSTGDYGQMSGTFTIPCEALPGETRMRVRSTSYYWFWPSTNITDPCSDRGVGETEDYRVVILETPTAFASADAVQQTGVVAPGVLGQKILMIPVSVSGCGVSTVTNLKLSTAGTNNTANIANAKLYSTGTSSTYSIANEVGVVAGPNGNFGFTLADTLEQGVTNYYWLAYDLIGGATLNDTLDARLDSIEILGAYHVPSNTNPSGNVIITAPMTVISSDAVQNDLSRAPRGTEDNPVMAMRVVTTAIGAPIELTQFDLSALGTTDTSNISNLKVWYTGSSSTFATGQQFGSTLNNLPGTMNFSITGSQWLSNGDNYFWLTYDIIDTATIGNLIDGEFTGSTISGAAHIPTVTAPAGAREIREEYCEPLITYAFDVCNWGNYYISSVYTTGANTNITNYTGCAGTANNYIVYPNITLATAQNQTVTINTYVNYGSVTVWIDYNQDGIYDNGTERVFMPTMTGNTWGTFTGTFTVPCDALTGTTRMRVRSGDYWWNGTPIDDPCADFGYGESEDYMVTIAPTPASFDFADAVQTTGAVAPGTMDQPILRVPVQTVGCGVSTVTAFHFSTSGTTAPSDIVSAKLYNTGTSTSFNTSNLVGSAVTSPSGAFTFIVADTLIPNAENQYWLAYDISGSATVANLIDATFDSLEILGSFETPTTSNPSGSMTVTLPMTYIAASASQGNLSKVGRGTANNEILGLMVITSSAGAPIMATQFDFAANGTTDTANIDNIRLWSTGHSSTFAANTQVGSTLAGLPGTMAFSIAANHNLLNDTNYFWLTYDIDGASTLTNLVDAEATSITIGGTPQIPTGGSPTGTREIREDYCAPIASYTGSCGNGYYISAVSTTGAVSNLNNYTYCSGGTNNYIYYNNQTMVATQGQNITISIGDWSSYLTYTVWIDFNQDGVFDNTTERVYYPTSTGDWGNMTGSFTIPSGASLGTTRMRVRGAEYYWFWPYSNISSPCNDVGGGETEDYNVMILPAPPPTTYVWNQTSPADFTDPLNWTPSRNAIYGNDKLVFDGGGSVYVYNVQNQPVSKITVDNATTVTMDAYSSITLAAADTLELTSGTIVANSNVTIGVGTDTTTVGTVIGTGHVSGIVKRWINSNTTSYTFPLSYNGNNNNVNLSFTAPPSSNGTIIARFISGAPGQTGLPLTDGAVNINKVSDYGVWRLTSGNGFAGGTFTGTFTGEGVPYVASYADLRVTRRLANIASWILDGTGVAATGSNTAPVMSRTGMTLLGEFAIGGDVSVNPLPVTLTTFKATASNGDVVTNWTTVSESNNKGFIVERSIDGRNFAFAGFVAGKGTTAKTTNYSFVDAKAFAVAGSQKLYYRLRQVDFNGDEYLSQVVMVNNNEKTTLASVSTYPNPFNQNISVDLNSTEAVMYTLTVTDLQGKVVMTQNVNAHVGVNTVELNNASTWNAGVYFLTVQGGAAQTIKLVKTN